MRDEEQTLPRLLESLRAQTRADCPFPVRRRPLDGRAPADPGRVLRSRRRPGAGDPQRAGARGRSPASRRPWTSRSAGAGATCSCSPTVTASVPPTWAEEMLAPFQRSADRRRPGPHRADGGPAFLGRFQAFEQPLLNQYNFGSVGHRHAHRVLRQQHGGAGTRRCSRSAGFEPWATPSPRTRCSWTPSAAGGGWKVRDCTSRRGAARHPCAERRGGGSSTSTRGGMPGALFSPDLVTRFSFIFVVLDLPGRQPRSSCRSGFLDWRVPVLSLNAFLSIGLLAALGRSVRGEGPRPLLPAVPSLPVLLRLLLRLRHGARLRPSPVRMEGLRRSGPERLRTAACQQRPRNPPAS